MPQRCGRRQEWVQESLLPGQGTHGCCPAQGLEDMWRTRDRENAPWCAIQYSILYTAETCSHRWAHAPRPDHLGLARTPNPVAPGLGIHHVRETKTPHRNNGPSTHHAAGLKDPEQAT